VLNKRGPMKKRIPPHILADEYFNLRDNAAIPPPADPMGF
jgi:hypothetical protein